VTAGQPGRMAVRGPTGLTYWRRPAKQHSDVQFGWSLQDDLIRFGNDGLADYLVRTDFMISTAGHKIAPVEVETALSSHPAVREAVVFGLPDATRRETVAAFVVLNQGFAESDGLRASCRPTSSRGWRRTSTRAAWISSTPFPGTR